MKFRYKILLINLVLLSLGIGIAGYLIINRNFELARDMQIKNAVMENNLKQASVEYELLQVLNDGMVTQNKFTQIGKQVASDMLSVSNSFYIRYGDEYVYASDGKTVGIPGKLFDNLNEGGKNYLIQKEQDSYLIYVTSYSSMDGVGLSVISKSDISELYGMLDEQISYFRILLVAVLFVASVILYQLCTLLTRPLEQLNRVTDEMANGHYAMRVPVNSGDEVGRLAENFNRMSQAVEEHVEKLQEMVRNREQFVADFIHEVKTPMTAIIGYADTMRSVELSSREQFEALNYIFFEGKRLEKLSGKLFELIYLGRHEIEKKPCHTTDFAEELKQSVLPMFDKEQMKLSLWMEEEVVEIDRELMITVFLNLLDNAKKASREGSVIEVQGAVMPECYEWVVTDHGIGMSKEDCAHACDEFYMADKSRSRAAGGAGLGMSLVALILKRHGAALSIESEPQKGTRVTIRLPFSEKGGSNEEN